MNINIADYISTWSTSFFAEADKAPWAITSSALERIHAAFAALPGTYEIANNIAVHPTAIIETGAVLKGPIILGPNTFIASSAYLRGGVFLDENCIVGPACELKTVFMFQGSKIAHLSFVGDSILGADVNIEAGAMIANYRNELEDKQIRIVADGTEINTATDKFGALIGDHSRIGANAVIAPGAILKPAFHLTRQGLLDQHPDAQNSHRKT